MVHIARCIPPSVALEGLQLFDVEVRQTFSDSMCIDPFSLETSPAELEQGWSGASQCIIALISRFLVFLFNVRLCYQH